MSRDRRWCLFENLSKDDSLSNFELIATTDKKNGIHGRIIWTCSWTHDSNYFATGSRDGKVVVWYKDSEKAAENQQSTTGAYNCRSQMELKNESITALAFAPSYWSSNQEYLIAIGLETGVIHLYSYGHEWKHLSTLDTR